jgi:hypothetical protein
MYLREIFGGGSVDWIYLAHDRGEWWNLLDTLMNPFVLKCVGNFLSAEYLMISQNGLSSMELLCS